MPEMQSWHRDFADGLVEENRGAPDDLFDGAPERVAAGWQVYRNNVAHSLDEVLRDTFPTVEALVGPDFFRFIAHEFRKQVMPATAMVWEYGLGFADFLGGLSEAKSTPYLGDVARLEFARWQSYHGPGEDAVMPEHLQSIPPEQFSEARLDLKTSLRIMRSKHRAVSIWLEHQKDRPDFSAITLDVGECGMTYRQHGHVHTRTIESPLAQFLLALQEGETLTSAAQYVIDGSEGQNTDGTDFSLEAALALLLSAALITDISVKGIEG